MLNIYNQHASSQASTTPELKKNTPDFGKYVDTSGELSSKDLRYGIWYVAHRLLLFRLMIFCLVAVSVILWGFSLWHWGSYLIFGLADDARLASTAVSTINYGALNQSRSVRPLQVLGTQIFPGGTEGYDVASEVVNPNPNFLVTIDYTFVVDGNRLPIKHATLLPGQDSLIPYLGLKNIAPTNPSLVIENFNWQRISNHDILDPRGYQAERINFSVTDFNFQPAQSIEGVNTNIITFSLTNNSGFAYTQPNFYIGLFDDQNLVGVMPWQADSFLSSETKLVDIRNFVPNLNVTRVQVFPAINVYDPAVYLKPRASL